MDEPQNRLTVTPPAPRGRPAMKLISRATFSPCSPSGNAQPTITSSMRFGIDAGSGHQRPHHLRRQIVRPHPGEQSLGGEMKGRAPVSRYDDIRHIRISCLFMRPSAGFRRRRAPGEGGARLAFDVAQFG